MIYEVNVGGPRYFIPQIMPDTLGKTGFCRCRLCVRTAHQRISVCGLSIQDNYSVITTQQLDQIVVARIPRLLSLLSTANNLLE